MDRESFSEKSIDQGNADEYWQQISEEMQGVDFASFYDDNHVQDAFSRTIGNSMGESLGQPAQGHPVDGQGECTSVGGVGQRKRKNEIDPQRGRWVSGTQGSGEGGWVFDSENDSESVDGSTVNNYSIPLSTEYSMSSQRRNKHAKPIQKEGGLSVAPDSTMAKYRLQSPGSGMGAHMWGSAPSGISVDSFRSMGSDIDQHEWEKSLTGRISEHTWDGDIGEVRLRKLSDELGTSNWESDDSMMDRGKFKGLSDGIGKSRLGSAGSGMGEDRYRGLNVGIHEGRLGSAGSGMDEGRSRSTGQVDQIDLSHAVQSMPIYSTSEEQRASIVKNGRLGQPKFGGRVRGTPNAATIETIRKLLSGDSKWSEINYKVASRLKNGMFWPPREFIRKLATGDLVFRDLHKNTQETLVVSNAWPDKDLLKSIAYGKVKLKNLNHIVQQNLNDAQEIPDTLPRKAWGRGLGTPNVTTVEKIRKLLNGELSWFDMEPREANTLKNGQFWPPRELKEKLSNGEVVFRALHENTQEALVVSKAWPDKDLLTSIENGTVKFEDLNPIAQQNINDAIEKRDRIPWRGMFSNKKTTTSEMSEDISRNPSGATGGNRPGSVRQEIQRSDHIDLSHIPQSTVVESTSGSTVVSPNLRLEISTTSGRGPYRRTLDKIARLLSGELKWTDIQPSEAHRLIKQKVWPPKPLIQDLINGELNFRELNENIQESLVMSEAWPTKELLEAIQNGTINPYLLNPKLIQNINDTGELRQVFFEREKESKSKKSNLNGRPPGVTNYKTRTKIEKLLNGEVRWLDMDYMERKPLIEGKSWPPEPLTRQLNTGEAVFRDLPENTQETLVVSGAFPNQSSLMSIDDGSVQLESLPSLVQQNIADAKKILEKPRKPRNSKRSHTNTIDILVNALRTGQMKWTDLTVAERQNLQQQSMLWPPQDLMHQLLSGEVIFSQLHRNTQETLVYSGAWPKPELMTIVNGGSQISNSIVHQNIVDGINLKERLERSLQ